MASETVSKVDFAQHVDLMRIFLANREKIADNIENLLNAQRTPSPFLQGPSYLARRFEDCFFKIPQVSPAQAELRGQLEQAYCAEGFQPRAVHYLHNDLIQPGEMLMRGVHCWQQTRWPGRGDRLHYAHTLFNLYLLRSLEFLSLRLWDTEPQRAGERLAQIQKVLDELWRTSPAHQPAFVRDARWLIPLAQSLVTDELAPYFVVAQQVSDTLSEADALEVWKAHVRMLGGHLCSQIRHYSTRDNLTIDDPSVVNRTRTSNALDLALLVQGLVELLRAYTRAVRNGDEPERGELAGAILQGISPDPELFLRYIDLLRAYCMIEHVFIRDDATYSPAGERYLRLVSEYKTLIAEAVEALRQDASRLQPQAGKYSPYGVLFGLPTNLLEHMALKAVQRDAETHFSLEDVFNDNPSPARLAWVNGWRNLPHVPRDVQRRFEFPQDFADEIYTRVMRELNRASEAPRLGSLRVTLGEESPSEYLVSSDPRLVNSGKAEPRESAQLLRDRLEGHFLVSYETEGGWAALRKELLTDVLAAGCSIQLTLPAPAADILRRMCGTLVEL